MRTTIALLALAVLAVAVLSACRARDDGEADSTADTTRLDETAAARDSVSADSSAPARPSSRPDTPATRRSVKRAGDPGDSSLPPEDSVRATRPEMPQVTPPKRPRTWRGFKLPEEMPVRAPVETIKRVEQVPDSAMKGDSTKPPPLIR